MKKLLAMMAVVATVMSLASCSQEKSIYQEQTKYLPVVLQGSNKWSILNVETGEVVAKDVWVNAPSPVVDDMFWVYNDKNRIDIYNVANCKEPVNKDVYGSATCYSGGYAIVSKPGEPLQVIDKECNTVAQLSPSILTASMFSNERSVVHTDLDRYGYIDATGDTVIAANLGYAAGFNEDDVALVSFSEASDSAKVLSVIDKSGKKLYDFDSEKYQEIFYTIWETLAERYGDRADRVAFELLNEVTEARFLPAWKRISRECVRRIRFFAPDTIILLGSYNWNSARTVPELDAPYDDKVVYNFHFYEPHAFTHQGAYWMPELRDKRMAYADCGASEAWFEDFLAPAVEKAKKENCELYCGEFGVIDVVPPEEAVKWFKDLHAVFERHDIAHAMWTWKQMDFGLIDARMDGVRDALLELL